MLSFFPKLNQFSHNPKESNLLTQQTQFQLILLCFSISTRNSAMTSLAEMSVNCAPQNSGKQSYCFYFFLLSMQKIKASTLCSIHERIPIRRFVVLPHDSITLSFVCINFLIAPVVLFEACLSDLKLVVLFSK